MIEEIDIYGVFLPSLLVWMVLAFVLAQAVRWALSRAGAYAHIWHRPLFDIALYVIILGFVVALARMLQ